MRLCYLFRYALRTFLIFLLINYNVEVANDIPFTEYLTVQCYILVMCEIWFLSVILNFIVTSEDS